MTFSMNDDGVAIFKSTLNYADPNVIKLTSPQGWGGDIIAGGQDGYLNKPQGRGRAEGRAPVGHPRPGRRPVQLRGRLQLQRTLQGPGQRRVVPAREGLAGQRRHPASAIVGTTSLAFIGIAGMVSYDPFALINSALRPGPQPQRRRAGQELGRRGEGRGRLSEGQYRRRRRQRAGDRQLRLPDGPHRPELDRPGRQRHGNGRHPTNLAGGKTYLDFLPSMNLQFHLPNEQTLRFAVARTLARPRMDQMRASTRPSATTGQGRLDRHQLLAVERHGRQSGARALARRRL
jgi:iron complex outermembrane receptor protein